MKIPFTLGICLVSIFELSKKCQRVGHLEETQMDKSQENKSTEDKFIESNAEDCLQLILKKSSHFL